MSLDLFETNYPTFNKKKERLSGCSHAEWRRRGKGRPLLVALIGWRAIDRILSSYRMNPGSSKENYSCYWPGASLWALGKQSHLVDIWELAKNSTKEGLSGKEAIRQHRKSGTLFTALYLKQCAVSLQQAYAGSESPKTLLPFPVSLTRSGYPMTFL